MPMPIVAHTDDCAVERVERGKQGRGSIALVIMRHGAAASLLNRQPRLRAVQGLDLALLAGAQHNGMLRRVEIETDDRLKLFSEFGIVADFERPRQMRLEAMLVPDPTHALFTETGGLRHRSRAPVGCVGWLLLGGLADHFLHLYRSDGRPAAATRSILFQA